jgi:hypothetical protein
VTKREILNILKPNLETIRTVHPEGPRSGEYDEAFTRIERLAEALERETDLDWVEGTTEARLAALERQVAEQTCQLASMRRDIGRSGQMFVGSA